MKSLKKILQAAEAVNLKEFVVYVKETLEKLRNPLLTSELLSQLVT